MTFSLIARCARSGHLGIAVATSDIAVGGRVAFAAAGVGAVLTQHRSDPRLGPRGLDLLLAMRWLHRRPRALGGSSRWSTRGVARPLSQATT